MQILGVDIHFYFVYYCNFCVLNRPHCSDINIINIWNSKSNILIILFLADAHGLMERVSKVETIPAQAVNHQLLTAGGCVCAKVSPCWICSGQTGTGVGLYMSFSVLLSLIILPQIRSHSFIIWEVYEGHIRGPVPHRHSLNSSQWIQVKYLK
jgi:hypothetical protein